jgi:hypothetical protein
MDLSADEWTSGHDDRGSDAGGDGDDGEGERERDRWHRAVPHRDYCNDLDLGKYRVYINPADLVFIFFIFEL